MSTFDNYLWLTSHREHRLTRVLQDVPSVSPFTVEEHESAGLESAGGGEHEQVRRPGQAVPEGGLQLEISLAHAGGRVVELTQ